MALYSQHTFAEYRVYQYYVKSKTQNISSLDAQIVTSTLNPRSYLSYNGGSSSIEISLLRSWMCPGHTGKKEICSLDEGKVINLGNQ